MGVQTEEISEYPVSRFNASAHTFWIGQVDHLLTRFAWLAEPHRQSFYMLLCMESSAGHVLVDHRSIGLEPYMIACVKPNSVFSLNIGSESKGCIVCFTEDFFSLRYNDNVLHRFAFLRREAASCIRLQPDQWEKWNFLLRIMSEEFHRQPKGAEKVLRSYLNVLLFDLERINDPSRLEMSGIKEEKLVLFGQLLEENFVEHKTPAFYAARLHITPNYLNKLCRELRGQTSGELIRSRIAIEAQRLLHYTSLSVAEIGYRLGFESPSYFITFFKRQTDSTPEAFRKSESGF